MRALLPLLLASLALAACSKTEPESSGTSTSSSPAASGAPGSSATAAATPAVPRGPAAHVVHPDLLDPSKASAKAPDVFKAKFTTTKGDFVVEAHRDWSPNGADRFYNLVKMGFYDDTRFFRAIDGFMVQWGISGDPMVSTKWMSQTFQDDPPGKQSNTVGMVTFAMASSPNSRSTQVFVNYGNNARLDASHFQPIGKIASGMDVVNSLYKGYGEGSPMGSGPAQGSIQSQGNAYLDSKFPKLDAIKHAGVTK